VKEAVGSYFLTSIVIVFIVLFTGYICLSINTNKAYKVKDEIINIIQKNNGLDEEALAQIQDYMSKVGYRTQGKCNKSKNENFTGYGVSGSASTDTRAVFCVRPIETSYSTSNGTKEQFPEATYYQIKVFFGIDLPIVRNLFTFTIKGSTKKLFYPVSM